MIAASLEKIKRENRASSGKTSEKDPHQVQQAEGPPGNFLTQLLADQCRLAKAEAGAIIRSGSGGQPEILSAYPQPGKNGARLSWISRAEKPFRKVMLSAKTVVMREGPESENVTGPQSYLIVVPITNQGVVRAAAAFRIKAQNRPALLLGRARLETTPILLDRHEMQLSLELQLQKMDQLRRVMEILDLVNGPTRFLEAAMSWCNELATRFGCNRVSLGFLEGRRVHVRAMSNTDTFSREMQVVQAIEEAMEECLDQDLEVVHPASDDVIVANRAAHRLAETHGPSAVLSLPIRQVGEVAAVLTLERHIEQPFDNLEEIETLRLIGDLCAPRVLDLHQNDRWLGARMATESKKLLGRLVGHEHTWIKLSALLIFLLGLFLATFKAEYRINTTFTLKAEHQQAIVAPFDTFSKSVLVEPGDRVEGGKTGLGTLETAELRLKLAALKAEHLGYQKQMTAAMRDRNTAEAQMAESQIDKVAAQIRMIENKIQKADLVAPLDGWVVSEDRKQKIGAPVKAGEILFEIASIDALRAELYIPESSIASVAEGHTGTLASVGHPDQKIRFVIERINPIAEMVDLKNVFRARARLAEHLDWMRPGMEGEARISAGKKTYLWIATHRFFNWLRMKLWL